MKKLIYLAMVLFVVACATKKTETAKSSDKASGSSSNAPVNVTAQNFKSSITDFTFESFTKGKMLYESKCNKCHPLKAISSQTVEGWNHQVTEMVKKYNKRFEDKIDEQAQDLIAGYVLTSLEMGVK